MYTFPTPVKPSSCPLANSGVVLSLEEVEGGLKGLKVGSEQNHQSHRTLHQNPHRGGIRGSTSSGTPFMAEHLEQALTGGVGPSAGLPRSQARDPDMSAFNKLVSSMKASGTLPTHPKANQVNNNVSVPLSDDV